MTYSNSAGSTLCSDLALEGERFYRDGDFNKGISCFLKALAVGTDDLSCLSVIYCQLGNAYFNLQDYARALEYHRWNFALARRMGDSVAEVCATGNLGNTLQMLGKYEEAIMCFTHELEIAKQLNDKSSEAGALYNLGNVYQAKGKQWLPDTGEYPVDAVIAQKKAAEYYKMGLELARELGDRPAEGRALGSLANIYYLMSNFNEAIECYEARLKIAKEYGDLVAQRRAHSNIGNTYIFLADFNSAVEHYREALQLSICLKDASLQAQACFSLGNTYILLRDPATAVVFLIRHLIIARSLADRIGEGRAHWSLATAYTALKRYDLALRCSKRHRQIAYELGDSTGYMTAHLMIGEISSLMMSTQTETTATDDDQTDSSQFLLSNNSKIRTATTTETNTTSSSSFPSSSVSTSVQPLNNSRLPNGIHDNDDGDDNNTTNIVLSNHNSSCVNSVVNTPIVDGDNCTVVNGLKPPSAPPSNSSTLSSALLDNWINIDRVNKLSGGKTSDSSVTTKVNNTDTSTTPATLDKTTPVTQYTDQATQTVVNDHDIFHDHEDSVDLELDKDLERELLENYEGILETVEFVTVTEDGETVTSRMGCLDVPTPVSSESKKENMVDFYLRIPAFRPNLSQQSDTSNLGDIEGNFESIESMSQMNRSPNLPNDLAYSGNTESGNTHAASSSAVAVAAASLVEEERSTDQQEMFFSLLLESQSRRMDEQRCYLRTSQGTPPVQSTEAATNTTTPQELDHDVQSSENPHQTPDTANSPIQSQIGANEEAFFDLIEGVQGDRMNDQRANLSVFPGLRSGPGLYVLEGNNRYFGSTSSMFKSTSSGASDGLPEPKLYSSNSGGVTGLLSDNSSIPRAGGSGGGGTRGRRSHIISGGDIDDEFLEMIFRIQTCTRINDQRSNLPDPLTQIRSQTDQPNYAARSNVSTVVVERVRTTPAAATTTTTTASNPHRELSPYTSSTGSCNLTNRCSAPAILDDDDLFTLIQRVQSTRLDEQRCHPPLQQSQSCIPTSSSMGSVANSISSAVSSGNNSNNNNTNNNSNNSSIVHKSSSRRRLGSRNSKRSNNQNK
ncbi:unnamed protein product [Trichobilharzia szidati]|nr:unnamed protein product [Trichobilharzia szidati]